MEQVKRRHLFSNLQWQFPETKFLMRLLFVMILAVEMSFHDAVVGNYCSKLVATLLTYVFKRSIILSK